MKLKNILMLSAMTLLLGGCISAEEKAQAKKIVTALPHEVIGCTFIADIDNSGPHSTIGQARFALMLEAAKLGGTHMVEMHAFPAHITFRLIGVELSARVYKCPEGRGPTVTRDEALMKVDYPMVDPEIYDIH